MNKKGFIDLEIIGHPAFVILAVFAVSATLVGWIAGPKMGIEASFPLWQLIIILIGEVIAAYVITLKWSS